MRKLAILIAVATATAAFTVATSAAQGTPTRFCNATVKLYSLFNNEPDDESSPEEVEAFGRRVSSQLEKLSTSAPPEVSANVEALIPIITASAGNEQDPFENPEFVTNYEAINEYLATSCGFESVDVTMADYEFVGIPRTLDTGTVAFNLTNEGAEFHELFVFRIKTDDSLREVLELSDRQLMRRRRAARRGLRAPRRERHLVHQVLEARSLRRGLQHPGGVHPRRREWRRPAALRRGDGRSVPGEEGLTPAGTRP